ncbi:NAD(P)H-dependent oxidoreductase [Oricola sp.]|uniref:NAD(P)H-dependent oxidoreductase n=1 Tax=Oricola sp. TaxID=1979950 RepID=UPI0025F22567|nr:NAD(P)H-dependent oxidoreductase [Oricola sp.]MCI5078005.1 NAD(P)H-dependent oxidoreductase [Oricola sp.]
MRICIINGHPDPSPQRYAHALATAYGDGAREGGHEVRTITVGMLDFPIVRTREDFMADYVPPVIREAQNTIRWADHVFLVYPLWHGMLPAYLKAFLEQVFRRDFAMEVDRSGWTAKLTGRSARIVVTMGMPSLFYRLYFHAHSLHALRQNILGFSGMRPVRTTIIGGTEAASPAELTARLKEMRALGRKGR